MIDIIIGLGIWTAGFIYHYWPRDPKAPPPGDAGGVPRTDEGATVPLIYGRCRVRAPVVAWIGNWRVNLSSSNSAGYQAEMLFVCGIPFNGGHASLQQIFAGDFALALIPQSTDALFNTLARQRSGRNFYLSVNAAVVYGGENGQGGIKGFIETFDGRPDQFISSGFNSSDPTDCSSIIQMRQQIFRYPDQYDSFMADPSNSDATLIPGYRNQTLTFLYQWSIGRTPNFTSYSFEMLGLSTGTASDFGRSLPDDADPAAVLFDLLTSPWGKLGFPLAKVDTASFAAASVILFGENHGYSRSIDQPEEATSVIADLLHQTDGMLYEEPTTGKLVYKLVRNDYGDPSVLQNINPDNARPSGPAWYKVQGWNETINQVRLTFTDRQNKYADGLAIAQNGANATSQSGRGIRSIDVKFVACCTKELAQRLASRELAAVSRPLVTATVIVNRSFYLARPGSVYTFSWPPLGIVNMVMRVARADLGQLHKNEITLDLIRDLFDVSIGAYPVPPTA